ncbi:MAG: SRPBCC family protein [Acidobacteria bacterium]|nr:SRPBCC family protein [Acidobacteriota bacterium]
MHSVTVSTFLSASPDQVWNTIGDPGGISSWHPVVAESTLEDGMRKCTLANGAVLAEQVDEVDQANRSYTYRIVDGPLPVEGYTSTIKVLDADGGCCVEWTASFGVTDGPAEETVGMIKGVYDAGMEALRGSF